MRASAPLESPSCIESELGTAEAGGVKRASAGRGADPAKTISAALATVEDAIERIRMDIGDNCVAGPGAAGGEYTTARNGPGHHKLGTAKATDRIFLR